MKVIGIIAAMEEEFEEIANIMSEIKEKEISKLTWTILSINLIMWKILIDYTCVSIEKNETWLTLY